MVDLTSPEARERIARAIFARLKVEDDDDPEIIVMGQPAWTWFLDEADAALSEVAAMLKEDGD